MHDASRDVAFAYGAGVLTAVMTMLVGMAIGDRVHHWRRKRRMRRRG